MKSSLNGKTGAVGVVFDGDDTLWSTEGLYDDARSAAGRIVARCGSDPATWEELEREADLANVANLGYSIERFPTSCVQAYKLTSRIERRLPDPAVARRIRRAAQSVFEREALLAPKARETLRRLQVRGARIALLTKGDATVQQRRVNDSTLRDLFDVVHIVGEKSADAIRAVLASIGVAPQSAWMIGNSVQSDILPAIEVGLHAVWIDAYVWEYERTEQGLQSSRVIRARDLAEVPGLIGV
jgi:putative hydrolase of the HAD superfamily